MPIELRSQSDGYMMLLVTMIAGAVGGLAAELLIARGGKGGTGALERPGWIGQRFYDLGSYAALPLGVVAALIALLLFSPIQEVVSGGVTSRRYELYRLVGLALAAGLSSQSFLRTIQDRFSALARNQRLDSALTGAHTALSQIEPRGHPSAARVGARPGASHLERLVTDATSQTPTVLMEALQAGKFVDREGLLISAKTSGGEPIRLKPESSPKEKSRQIDEVLDRVTSEVSESILGVTRAQTEIARKIIEEAQRG